MTEDDIAFRRLQPGDMQQLHEWLKEPHVREWYDVDEPTDLQAVTERYMPLTTDEEPTRAYIIPYQGNPIGYIQGYNLEDDLEEMRAMGFDEHAAGVDLFIGVPDVIGLGIGTKVIGRFLQEEIFTRGGIEYCTIDPEANNKRAIRAYEKVGFQFVRVIQMQGESQQNYIMQIRRSDFIL